MANDHMGAHAWFDGEIKGQKVAIDAGILDLVLWLNDLPGVDTFTSCQGGACTADGYIGFNCTDPASLNKIKQFIKKGRFSEHNGSHRVDITITDLQQLNRDEFAESEFWPQASTCDERLQ